MPPNTSRTLLDDFAHEQTIIWRQSFAGQAIGSRPIKRKKNSLRIIIDFHVGRNISLSIIAVLSTVGPRCIAEGLLSSSADKNCYFDPWLFVTFSLCLFYTHSMLSVLFWIINLANGHSVDDISFIFSFVLCGMSIFVSTVTEVSISFLGLRYIDN